MSDELLIKSSTGVGDGKVIGTKKPALQMIHHQVELRTNEFPETSNSISILPCLSEHMLT